MADRTTRADAARDFLVEPTHESRINRTRRTMLFAARLGLAMHVCLLITFAVLGIRVLAVANIASVAAFLAMSFALQRGRLVLGLVIALVEVTLHQILATAMLGWDAGFALLIVASTPAPFMLPKSELRTSFVVFGLLAFAYIGLFTLCANAPPFYALSPTILMTMSTVNAVGALVLLSSMIYQYARASDDAEAAFAQEHARSERLLASILPPRVAERLKQQAGTVADGASPVTVLFSDLVGFTPLSSKMSPPDLVALLDEIFSAFDELAAERGLTKIKTIGDAYMVAAGVPDARRDHAEAIADFALAMVEVVKARSRSIGEPLEMRVGIHVGPVVAGVIGKRTLAYDLWGDTVNIASRMESHGAPGRIHVTEAAQSALDDTFDFEDRGLCEIKGKGRLRTFYLVGRKGEPPQSLRSEETSAGDLD
jgi:adenylate cyclase